MCNVTDALGRKLPKLPPVHRNKLLSPIPPITERPIVPEAPEFYLTATLEQIEARMAAKYPEVEEV